MQDGIWAGHMEVQAASLVLRRNICIHQAGQPVWAVNNFEGAAAGGPPLHLSYHDGEHYNSVRMAGGNEKRLYFFVLSCFVLVWCCGCQAGDWVNRARLLGSVWAPSDADLQQQFRQHSNRAERTHDCFMHVLSSLAMTRQLRSWCNHVMQLRLHACCTDDYGCGVPEPIRPAAQAASLADGASSTGWGEAEERQVSANTACDNPSLVRKCLELSQGDVDAAIELVIEAMTSEAEIQDQSRSVCSAAGVAPSNQGAALAAAAGVASPMPDSDIGAPGVSLLQGVCSTVEAGTSGRKVASAAGAAAVAADDRCDGFSVESAVKENGLGEAVKSCSTASGPEPPKSMLTRAAARRAGIVVGEVRSDSKRPTKPSNNKACPCGSKQKYKSCCGAAAEAAERRRLAAEGSGAAAALAEQLQTLCI